MADKRAKVHRLPTKAYTNVVLNTYINVTHRAKAIYHIKELMCTPINSIKDLEDRGYKFQHLYFTTDEEIKEGDWYYVPSKGMVYRNNTTAKTLPEWEKVVATTDESLKIGHDDTVPYPKLNTLPQPSQAFIDKYCQVGGIDEVLISYTDACCGRCIEGMDECIISPVVPKVDAHNTITIHPVKDSWSREEVTSLILSGMLSYKTSLEKKQDFDSTEWLDKNL